MVMGPGPTADEIAAGARLWWVFLVTGIMWLIYAFIVLSLDFTTVLAIAVLAGCMFIGAGLVEFVTASVVEGWKWLHAALGVAGIAAGIIAFAWPDKTFKVLAVLLAFYLLAKGIVDIVVSLMSKDDNDLWWLLLVAGIVEVLVGFWATGYVGRAIVLLVVWVAATALIRGITEIFLAFGLRGARGDLAA